MAGYDPLTLSWRARPGVTIVEHRPGEVEVTVDGEASAVLKPGTAVLAHALGRLDTAPGLTEGELLATAGSDHTALARTHYALARFIANGLLLCGVFCRGRALATLIPRRRDFTVQPPAPGLRAILSRFAYIRRIDDALILACPGAACEIALHGEQPAAWLAACAQPVAIDPAAFPQKERSALYRLAMAHGLLEQADESGLEPEAEPAGRASWEFHDRLFHHAARSFDDQIVRGGTFRFVDRFPSPPATRRAHAGVQRSLPAVEPTAGGALSDVMDRRRSRREMSDRPVSLAAVGEVMWRVARTVDSSRTGPQETIRRPYPSGGSLHELEFYLAVGACEGLATGFYHYAGAAHRLTELCGSPRATDGMLKTAAAAWGQPGKPPQVLVVIASRLPRLAWKYTGIAYKVSLLNAGVAIQSLYLVTTDMGLAGAAMGSGNPDMFAQATGCDPFEETSIAEFGFGMPAADA